MSDKPVCEYCSGLGQLQHSIPVGYGIAEYRKIEMRPCDFCGGTGVRPAFVPTAAEQEERYRRFVAQGFDGSLLP